MNLIISVILAKGLVFMQKSETKKRTLVGFLSRLAFFAFIISCVVSIISTQSTLADKRGELAEMQLQHDELEAENGELTRLVSGENLSEYMEMLATQQLNYSYPNERRFYDTIRN